MADIVEDTFREWTEGKTLAESLIAVFERIRDIPYAVHPEINSTERYPEILSRGSGSCTPKHFLLYDMFRRLGMSVLYLIYPFRWDETGMDYPPRLRTMSGQLPVSHHLACLVEIGGRLTLVDATVDPALKVLGLPVNECWDGISDTLLPVEPCGETQIYHPSEAHLMQVQRDHRALEFYTGLNKWLESVRRNCKAAGQT